MARAGEQTRKRILEVATELFGRQGFEKATVRQIADRLHISEPAVYRYFKNKEALGTAVLSGLVDRLEFDALFGRLEKETDVEILLRDLALYIVTLFSQRQELCRLVLYSALSGHTQAHGAYRAIRGTCSSLLRRQLDRLYKQKRIRKVNNEITARCFVGMVFDCALTYTLWKGMQGKVYAPADVVANNVSLFSRGLRIEAADRR